MRAVNLLPAERRAAKRRSPLAPLVAQPLLVLAVLIAIAAAGGVVTMLRSADSSVSSRQGQLASLQARLASLPKPAPAASPAAESSGRQRMAALTSVVDQRMTWDGFLDAFSRVVPEDVWLLNLSADSTSAVSSAVPASPATPASTPTAFTVTGYTYSQPSVARLLRRLALVPWLSDVSLSSSKRYEIASRTVFQFTASANIVKNPEVTR